MITDYKLDYNCNTVNAGTCGPPDEMGHSNILVLKNKKSISQWKVTKYGNEQSRSYRTMWNFSDLDQADALPDDIYCLFN